MCKNILTFILLCTMTLLSCSGGGGKGQSSKDIPALLMTVPSDALAVVSASRCEDALALYDSTSVLHRLSLGRLSRANAVLSICYSGSAVPVLAIRTPYGQAADSTSDAFRLMRQAASLKLYAEATEAGGGALVITPSEAQMQAVRRHLQGGTSILAAPDFVSALGLRRDADDFIILKNSGAQRLVPRDVLSKVFSYREMTSFLKTLSEWTVLSPAGAAAYEIDFYRNEGSEYFANLMDAIPSDGGNLSKVLPVNAEFVMAMAAGSQEFRDAFRKFKDASVKLTSYEKKLATLRKDCGKDPLAWEKETGVREIALMVIPEGKIFMVKHSKKVADKDIAENPYRGFAEALYGSAFSCGDDSCTAIFNGWQLFGSENVLQAFIASEKMGENFKWPKGYRLYLLSPKGTLEWGKKGIKYEISVT